MKKHNLVSKLKNQIIIEKQIKTEDQMGGHETLWHKYIECYANVKPLYYKSAVINEKIDDGHFISNNYYQFLIRKINNLSTQIRIKFDNRIFKVLKVVEDFNHDNHLLLITKEEI